MIPEVIAEAARDADKEYVAAWLDEHPQSVNDVDADGTSLLHVCLAEDDTYDADRLDLVEYLISRGADVNQENNGVCPLHQACGGIGQLANNFVVLLIGAGSQINRRVADDYDRLLTLSPLGLAIDNFLCDRGHSGKLAMVCTLLRAGASLDDCAGDDSAEEQVTKEEQGYKFLTKRNWHFAALKTVIKDVSAAGSWKKYCRRRGPHRDILRLRSFVIRGRATTSDKWVAGMVRLKENGLVWKVLSFWRDPDDVEEIETTLPVGGASQVVRVYD